MTADVLFEAIERIDANRRASTVLDIAAFTLLIDLNLATHEQVAQHIEKIQNALPEEYQADDVRRRVQPIADWIRGHAQKPRGHWFRGVIEGGLDQTTPSDPIQPKK
jgi:hypothetical protein